METKGKHKGMIQWKTSRSIFVFFLQRCILLLDVKIQHSKQLKSLQHTLWMNVKMRELEAFSNYININKNTHIYFFLFLYYIIFYKFNTIAL